MNWSYKEKKPGANPTVKHLPKVVLSNRRFERRGPQVQRLGKLVHLYTFFTCCIYLTPLGVQSRNV